MTSEKKCYIGINGKKYGPITEQEIINLFNKNKINKDTKFARIGDSVWTTIAESGILSFPSIDDEVLPLSSASNEKQAVIPEKKSKLGLIVAGLSVVVLVAVSVMIWVIYSMSNNISINENTDTTTTTQSDISEKIAQNIAESDIEQEYMSPWTLASLQDDFGDDMGEKFISGLCTGIFSNSAVSDRKLTAQIVCNDPGIDNKELAETGLFVFRLLEYGENKAQFIHVKGEPILKTKVDGVIDEYAITITPDFDLVLLSDVTKFKNYLYDGKEISCIIEIDDSKYNFTINGIGFSKLFDEFQPQWKSSLKSQAPTNLKQTIQPSDINLALPTLKGSNIDEQVKEIIDLFYRYRNETQSLASSEQAGALLSLFKQNSLLLQELMDTYMWGHGWDNYSIQDIEEDKDVYIVQVRENLGDDGDVAFEFYVVINNTTDYYIKDVRYEILDNININEFKDITQNSETIADIEQQWPSDELIACIPSDVNRDILINLIISADSAAKKFDTNSQTSKNIYKGVLVEMEQYNYQYPGVKDTPEYSYCLRKSLGL